MATNPAMMSIPLDTDDEVTTPIGQMRVNTTTNMFEVFEGTRWIIANGLAIPETWQEWLKRYATDMGEALTVRRDYINKSMQTRFPGRYTVAMVGGDWGLVFATPADETWFRLQHDK